MVNTIQNVDCLIGMQSIPDKSIDMILCDLPYGTTACKWDVIIPFDKLWEQYERIIKDNGAIVLTASQPFTSALVMSNIKMFKYDWIWEKGKATQHANCHIRPLKAHEDILVFYKAKPTYNPQFTEGKPYKGRKRIIQTDDWKNYGSKRNDNSGFRYPRTVLKESSGDRDGRLHPTQKPILLMEYLIKTYTNEGEIVVDNCMGSGTTAIACINTNRNYIGFEKDETYFNIITDRVKKHTVQPELFAA